MAGPFYKQASGLRFECTRCGKCCSKPGPVYFSGGDLERAARFLDLSPARFRRRYHVVTIDGVPAIDPGDRAPCTFLDPETGCTIYEGRPTQCRTFPFWPEVVRRRRSWEKAAVDCEGIGRGPRHSPEEIEQALVECEVMRVPEGEPW